MNELIRLNLGSCDKRMPGFLSVDYSPPADVVCDLNDRWPWDDSSVEEVLAEHIFEHLRDKRHTMDELWRVLRPGGRATVEIPCAAHGAGAFQDPTHVTYWTGNDFSYYKKGCAERERFRNNTTYGIKADFKIVNSGHREYNGEFDVVHIFRVVLEAIK